MDSTLIAAISSFLGAAAITSLGWFFKPRIDSRRHENHRKSEGINIIGRWYGEYHVADKVYENDIIQIDRWVKDNQFVGNGHADRGDYEIRGEMDSSRILVATYRSLEYPTQGNIGVIVLELLEDARTMEGYWYGRSLVARGIQGGRYIWRRP